MSNKEWGISIAWVKPLNFFKQAQAINQALLQWVLPHRCVLCETSVISDNGLCSDCFPRLHFIGQPACSGCGDALYDTVIGRTAPLCGTCLQNTPLFDHAVAALAYNDAASHIILRYKHADRLDLGPVLSRWMAFAWQQSDPPPIDYILPVPLHWRRHLERRYNQSLELSKRLLPIIGGELSPHLVCRTKNTTQMRKMNRRQRQQNVHGVFEISAEFRQKIGRSLHGKHVLIVDDVFTTGSTLTAVAQTLRYAQTGSVSVLVAAKVIQA